MYFKKESRGLLNQYIAGLSACLSVITSGSNFGWMAPTLNYLMSVESVIPLTSKTAPWIVSIIEIGNVVSPLPAGILINYLGRKPVILASGPVYIFGWLLIIYFPSVWVLAIARLIHGLAMGLALTAVPVYLGEIAGDEARGAISSLCFITWWFGFTISYAAGAYLSFNDFNWFSLALNIPLIVFFAFQPDTPHYHLLIGNEDKAYTSLKWFRDSHPDKLKQELEEIRSSMEENAKKSSIRDIFATPGDRKALLMLMVLTAIRICSGTGSITVYCTHIFDKTPNLFFSSNTITISLGIVMLCGSIVGSFCADTLGRRPLLIISSVGCFLCQFFVGTYYFLLFKTSVAVSNFSWISPVMILIYSALCTAGLCPVCTCYTSELFSTHTRGIAASFGAINATICSFIMLVTFQPIWDWLGLYVNFYIYAITAFFSSFYFYLSAPETKGKSFAKIRKEICHANG